MLDLLSDPLNVGQKQWLLLWSFCLCGAAGVPWSRAFFQQVVWVPIGCEPGGDGCALKGILSHGTLSLPCPSST